MPLHFDIDELQLLRAGDEIGASEKQVRLAFGRALTRTASTLRRISERGIRSELELRSVKFLRIRLKSIKLKRTAGGQSVSLWYGLNDMPVGEFKGRPKKTAAGAEFRGTEFKGGFTGKNKRRQPTIFKRVGTARLPVAEQTMPVKDRMDVFIEDNVFDQTEEIFWKHFMADLNARVRYGIGER